MQLLLSVEILTNDVCEIVDKSSVYPTQAANRLMARDMAGALLVAIGRCFPRYL